jgi:O-antigen/teichoic acid export membrane protein
MSAAIWILRPRALARGGFGFRAARPVVMRNISAPLYLFPAGLLDVLTQQLPVLLIATWFSSQLAGQFGLAWRVLLFPVSLISAAAGQVFFQRASKIWPAQDELRAFMLATWKVLAGLSIAPTFILMLFAPEIFTTVFGRQWKEAGAIAQVLAPMAFAMFVSSPTSAVVLLLGMQKTSLKFGMAFLCYRVASIYIAVAAGDLRLGLQVWVVCELVAIFMYNVLMLQRMERT